MKPVVNKVNAILEYGTDQTGDYKLKRNIRFANMGIWIGIVSVSVFIIKNIYLSRYDAALFELFILLLLFGAWRINKKHYLAAVVVVIIMMELFFLACALLLFPGNRVELFFLFMAIIPHIFFFNTFWTTTFFLLNMLLYFVPQLVLHPYEDSITNHLVHVSVFSAVFFIVRFFRLQMEGYEKVLTRQNERLSYDKTLIESQAAELRQIDKDKTDFFANVSHEFRTPLTLILGMAEKMKQEQSLNDRGVNLLQKISGNAERMSAMIEEILRLAKIGKTDYKLLPIPMRIRLFMGKHVDIFSLPAEENNIRFHIDVVPEDLTIRVDEGKFDHIFINLLSNAIKYSPKGGNIYLEAYEENDVVVLKVRDEGIGLKEGESEDVFERYNSTAEYYQLKGTGIGLALTKELVELHEGTIYAKPSINGKGATFVIELPGERKTTPVEGGESAAPAGPKQDVPTTSKARLLLAEDNAEMREYLAELFSGYGYDVTTASGGNEAWHCMMGQVFDILVTDYMMPDKDGYELAVDMKAHPTLKNVPIVFLTAKGDDEEKLKVLQLGIDDYVMKPFNKSELLIRIGNCIEHSRSKNNFLLSDNVEIREPEDLLLAQNFQKLVENHISDTKLKIPFLAEELAIEERSLYRKIKAITGLTPNEFIKEIKLQYARKLFENRSYATFKEVAFAVGFETAFYFCKLFEKRFGKHPSEY